MCDNNRLDIETLLLHNNKMKISPDKKVFKKIPVSIKNQLGDSRAAIGIGQVFCSSSTSYYRGY